MGAEMGVQMSLGERLWQPVRQAGRLLLSGGRLSGVERLTAEEWRAEERKTERRRTAPLPGLAQRFGGRNELLPKKTPETLRRFAETPVARKAINTIKDRVAGMNWRIQPRRGRVLGDEMKARIKVLTETLEQPNPDDSFRSFSEQVLEDIIVGGYGAVEMRLTGNE